MSCLRESAGGGPGRVGHTGQVWVYRTEPEVAAAGEGCKAPGRERRSQNWFEHGSDQGSATSEHWAGETLRLREGERH